MIIQLKATKQDLTVVLFTMLYKVVLTFESLDKIKATKAVLSSDKALLTYLRGCITGILLVFHQNFAKIIIKCLHSNTKCSWHTKTKTKSEFS